MITVINSYNVGNGWGVGVVNFTSNTTIHNCYNIGDVIELEIALIPEQNSTNIYYIEGKEATWMDNDLEGLKPKPLSYMKSQAFVDELNANCEGHEDWARWKLGLNGYPVLDI